MFFFFLMKKHNDKTKDGHLGTTPHCHFMKLEKELMFLFVERSDIWEQPFFDSQIKKSKLLLHSPSVPSQTSFHLFKERISKHSHFLRYRGLGAQYSNWGWGAWHAIQPLIHLKILFLRDLSAFHLTYSILSQFYQFHNYTRGMKTTSR